MFAARKTGRTAGGRGGGDKGGMGGCHLPEPAHETGSVRTVYAKLI